MQRVSRQLSGVAKLGNLALSSKKSSPSRCIASLNKSMLNKQTIGCMSIMRHASSLVQKFEDSVSALPLREAVRYTEKNMKWSASELKGYVDSHANALIEHGFRSGEKILMYLPEGAEKHVTLLAAAKIGLHVIDISVAQDSILSVDDMRSILTTAGPKAFIFEPVNAVQDNLLLLRKAIPEFFYYDDTKGQHFHSKHWPSLEYFIHTGFDVEMGALNYKHMFLRDPVNSAVDATASSTDDKLPVYSVVSKQGEGWSINKTITQKDALAEWKFADQIVKQQYFEA